MVSVVAGDWRGSRPIDFERYRARDMGLLCSLNFPDISEPDKMSLNYRVDLACISRGYTPRG
jgi:hypothetical protein